MTHIGLLAVICAVLLLSIAAAWGAIAFASGALGDVMLTPYRPLEFICACDGGWWPEVASASLAVAVFCLWTMTSEQVEQT